MVICPVITDVSSLWSHWEMWASEYYVVDESLALGASCQWRFSHLVGSE